MKKYTGLAISILICLLAFVTYHYKVGNYTTDYYYDCIVTHKLQTSAGYKVQAHFILVLNNDGRTFDIKVTPTAYANAVIGEKLTFKLSEADIQPIDSKENWITLTVILWFISLVWFVAWGLWKALE